MYIYILNFLKKVFNSIDSFKLLLMFIFTSICSYYSTSLSASTPTATTAKYKNLMINADVMEHKAKSIELSGNIQVIFKGQHLRANKAIIYKETKLVEAEGDIELITPKSTIGGDKIIMNYETGIGTIYRGYILSGQVFFEGDIIEKTGDESFISSHSTYTSCTTCPPAWSFSGTHIDAELGGYAYIKNSFLKFGNIPVLWLPYLIVPLKSERQTGLLTPSFDISKSGGLAIGQPFFWAISRSSDATFTFKNYDLRGLKVESNYRYMLNDESYGEITFATIKDRVFVNSDRWRRFHSSDSSSQFRRWNLKYKHYSVLPNNWIHRMDLNTSSDLQYSADFPLETKFNADSALENRISLTKNTDHNHFSIDNSYYINLLKSDPSVENTGAVHRLPEIHFSSTKQNIFESGFLFDYELQYTNFYRSDFAYDDLTSSTNSDGSTIRSVSNTCGTNPAWDRDPNCHQTRDGQFNPRTDIIRSGQRLLFEPTLSYPLKWGHFFNLTPKAVYQESHYSFGIEELPNLTRRALRTEVNLQTSFSRIYSESKDFSSTRYKHEIQPELIASTVPWLDQPSHPFLGFKPYNEATIFKYQSVSNKDFFGDYGIQFDYNDRLYDRSIITARVTNKLMKKSWSGGSPSYENIMLWRLSQRYDAYQASQIKNSKPFSDIESILNIKLSNFNTYTKLNYFPYQKITDASSRVSVNDDRGNFAQLGLSRKYLISENGTYDRKERTEDYELLIGTSAKYVNFVGKTVYDANYAHSTRIKSWGYSFIIKPPGNCWSIYFFHNRTGNDDHTSFQFDFLFDGKTSTQVSKESFNQYGS